MAYGFDMQKRESEAEDGHDGVSRSELLERHQRPRGASPFDRKPLPQLNDEHLKDHPEHVRS